MIIAYWTVWFTRRELLARSGERGYLDFENAFPAADAWLTLCLLLAARACLTRREAAARRWLTASVGGGAYLFAMDVLYDIEHRIWFTGGAGATEAIVNVLTLGMCVTLWLLSPREPRDPREPGDGVGGEGCGV